MTRGALFQSQEGYQLKEAHRKASAWTERLWVSILDLPAKTENNLPFDCEDVERIKREIIP
jgi:hypothetical protein